MSAVNYIHTALDCPFCGRNADMAIETKFGFNNQMHFRIGDKFPWGAEGTKIPYSVPPNGNFIGEGYGDCPNCGQDFFVRVEIRGFIIESVKYDPRKSGYSPPKTP